jgi:hypothetical protein
LLLVLVSPWYQRFAPSRCRIWAQFVAHFEVPALSVR